MIYGSVLLPSGNAGDPIGQDTRRNKRDTRILKHVETMPWKRKLPYEHQSISLAADIKKAFLKGGVA
jgi:hypothetical protein